MAALLVAALCVPDAFGDLGLTFAIAYGIVRGGADRAVPDRQPRTSRRAALGARARQSAPPSVSACSSIASFLDGWAQGAVWALALLLDMGGPFLIGTEGWTLHPEHFAERHGLIIIIALGESIVAIGVGAEAGVDAGVIVAAVLGVALAAAQWWAYFDVVAIVAARRAGPAAGRPRPERDGP